MSKPVIRLWDSVGLGIIIAHPSGVVFSNQTGGTACLQPELEGVFVPLRNDVLTETQEFLSPERDLCEHFTGPKHCGAGATPGLDSEDADFIDGVLAKHRLADVLRVERNKLRDSHEAWVQVVVSGDESDEHPVFSGFGPYPRQGVLTWSNSD